MLKPDYFYGKSDQVLKYYQDLEDYLLEDIAMFLLRAGEIGGKADRELFILEQMGMKESRITKKLAELSGKSRNAVRKVLQDSVMTSFSNDKEVLDNFYSGEYGPLNNPVIVEVMNAEWIKTCGELDNLTRTTMGQYNYDVIRLLNQAEIRVASGVQGYAGAICDVLDEYAKAGMVINYPTGARMTLESAVRCAVVTSMNQTAAQVTNKYISEGGVEYVLVSAHTGARHSEKGGLYSHDEWQGKAYKIRGSEEGYPNLLEATGYDIDPETGNGTVVNPAGLHGYNCRHSHQPWSKGLDNPWIKPDGTPVVDPEESRKKYELLQQQRAMERSIRSSKRQLKMKQTEIKSLKDDVAKEQAQMDYDKLAYKLKEKNKKYDEFCSENKLPKQEYRVKVAGFTQADARKARVKQLNDTQSAKNLAYRDFAEKNKISAANWRRQITPSDLNSKQGNLLEMDLQFFARTGKERADDFSKIWKSARLEDVLNKYIPNYTSTFVNERGKIVYSSDDSIYSVVYDFKGNYFRIENTTLSGKRRYVDLDGKDVSNVFENGSYRGRTREEYESMTHFNAILDEE